MSSQNSPETMGHLIQKKPYYLSAGDEIKLFEVAFAARIPVMLKGPT